MRLDALIKAYPDALSHHKDNMLYFNNGELPMKIDDGIQKNHSEKLKRGDIEDSLSQIYPAGLCKSKHQVNFEPGRIRSDKLMRILYGHTKSSVRDYLTSIDWFGQKAWISTRHGADTALLEVRNIFQASPHLYKYLKNMGGTFNWRKISGTSRHSAHSFGIAIDLNTKYANYWRWDQSSNSSDIRPIENKYPLELISVFEDNGFIWGGRWYHYDTMHFEYRPELIAISRLSDIDNVCSKH